MVPSLPSRAEDERGDGLMQKPVYEHLDGSGVEDLGPGSFRSCAEGTAHGIGMEGGVSQDKRGMKILDASPRRPL